MKTKKQFIADLKNSIEWYEKQCDFVADNGWNQVNGKGEAINRAYGEYATKISILEELEN